MTRPSRLLLRTALMLTLVALSIAACGGGDDEKPAIRAAGFNFDESRILSWIYALVLEDAGFEVDTSEIEPGSTREILKPALEAGEVDYVPEYTGTLLAFLGGEPTSDGDSNHAQAIERFASHGVTLLDYAPAQNTNAFVVTGEFAERTGISKLSELVSIAGEVAYGGPPECPSRPLCMSGLQDVYGIEFREFSPLDFDARVAALREEQIDVAMFFSTDATIAVYGWTLLDDDRGLQPAENVSLAIRQEMIDIYGDALVTAINAITAELTTEILTELNRRVQVDGARPRDVARRWLEEGGYLRSAQSQ